MTPDTLLTLLRCEFPEARIDRTAAGDFSVQHARGTDWNAFGRRLMELQAGSVVEATLAKIHNVTKLMGRCRIQRVDYPESVWLALCNHLKLNPNRDQNTVGRSLAARVQREE